MPWRFGVSAGLISVIGEAKALESSKATANRYLALVRAILRRARDEWEWVDRIPKVRLYPQSQRRVRWITREQAETLIAFLPPHQAAMARFALATGLRQRNVCLLVVVAGGYGTQTAWIHADQAKARKPIAVPLNAEAMAVLRGQVGQDPKYVFTYQGKPVWQVNTSHGERLYGVRAWRISGGMIYGTPGLLGMCRQERLHTFCKRWGHGQPLRWYGGMHTSRRHTWRSMRSESCRSYFWHR